MEKYHPRTALRIQLGRLLLLYIASCASMLYGFMLIAEDGQCWETKIGQEMLKLTIIDLERLQSDWSHFSSRDLRTGNLQSGIRVSKSNLEKDCHHHCNFDY